jgi:hypothetical protein
MTKETGRVMECGKCGKRLYPPVTFVAPGNFRVNTSFPNIMIQKHILADHTQDLDPIVVEYLRHGGPCPKCHMITKAGPDAASHAMKCRLIPWEFKPVRVILENRQEGNREFVVDVEKNTIVAETQWPVGVSVPEKTAEPKAAIPEEPMPEEEIPEVEAEAQVSSEAPPSSQEPPTPSQAEVTPPSVPHTTTNKPTSSPISMKQGASSRPSGKEQPSEEEGEEEEEEVMEAPELEDIEWRPVTDLVKQYGEPFHLKRRPKVRRREEYEEEVEFEEVRPRPKKKSYFPYVAIGLLAVAAVAYFLYRRQRAPVQPGSGSPLGVPTGITPVAPSVSPTPPPTSQQSTPKSSTSEGEKPTTTPIVADWSEKLKII